MCTDFPHAQVALNPPLRTADLEGIGGELKTHPEDFRVTEIPAYMPSGEGDHLWITIEKRDLTHRDMLKRFANTLELHEKEIGFAGVKTLVAQFLLFDGDYRYRQAGAAHQREIAYLVGDVLAAVPADEDAEWRRVHDCLRLMACD